MRAGGGFAFSLNWGWPCAESEVGSADGGQQDSLFGLLVAQHLMLQV